MKPSKPTLRYFPKRQKTHRFLHPYFFSFRIHSHHLHDFVLQNCKIYSVWNRICEIDEKNSKKVLLLWPANSVSIQATKRLICHSIRSGLVQTDPKFKLEIKAKRRKQDNRKEQPHHFLAAWRWRAHWFCCGKLPGVKLNG